MPRLIIRCPAAAPRPGARLGASAALYARNAVVVVLEPRCAPRRVPKKAGMEEEDGEEEEEMTASMACAMAASSASALGNCPWP